jgi:ribosomal protein S17
LATKKYSVHDEKNEAKVGDVVSIIPSRPRSAQKHHSLEKIISHAALKQEDIMPIVEEVSEEAEK